MLTRSCGSPTSGFGDDRISCCSTSIPHALGADVRYENLEGGEQQFPHVYGPIPVAAVVQVLPFRPVADGTFSDALVERKL